MEQNRSQSYYLYEGTVYVLVYSKETGKPYAKALTDNGWEYARGIAYRLQPWHRLTLEQAKTYGKLHGRCAVCGKILTNPAHAEAGIGPVCAQRVAA